MKQSLNSLAKKVAVGKVLPAMKKSVVAPPANNLQKSKLAGQKATQEIRHKQVTSANLKEFTYNKNNKTLRILFNSGRVYEYANVSEVLVKGLEFAKSKGTYFNRYFKYAKSYTEVLSLHKIENNKPR